MNTSGPHLPSDLKKPDVWSPFFSYQIQQDLKGFQKHQRHSVSPRISPPSSRRSQVSLDVPVRGSLTLPYNKILKVQWIAKARHKQ